MVSRATPSPRWRPQGTPGEMPSMVTPPRSEGSDSPGLEILRSAQDDKIGWEGRPSRSSFPRSERLCGRPYISALHFKGNRPVRARYGEAAPLRASLPIFKIPLDGSGRVYLHSSALKGTEDTIQFRRV